MESSDAQRPLTSPHPSPTISFEDPEPNPNPSFSKFHDPLPAAADALLSDDPWGSSSNVSSSYGGPTVVDVSVWGDYGGWRDDDIMQQHSDIRAEEAVKVPFVGDKETLSVLEAEYQSGNSVLQEKIKLLGEEYAAFRRSRGDGNCFFRCFMFSYLERILETQDKAEAERVTASVQECRKTLHDLGYADFTFEDFFSIFLDQLEFVLEGKGSSISVDDLLQRCRDQSISDYVVMFFRFVTAGEIRRRSEFFEPFIVGLTNSSVDQFCKSSVEPMGEESDHVHIIALTDALGVPIRVVYLDSSTSESGTVSINHHDFVPTSDAPEDGTSSKDGGSTTATTKPFITLLYRPGHYDILYPK